MITNTHAIAVEGKQVTLGIPEAGQKDLSANIPLRRPGTVEEAAGTFSIFLLNLVLMLASLQALFFCWHLPMQITLLATAWKLQEEWEFKY